MVRHPIRPYFLESCESEMLLWRCYTTKEASKFRNKVPKIILGETNVGTFNTYLGYEISFLILFSWLRNHVQSQHQKNKVIFGSFSAVGWLGVPMVQVVFGSFWGVLDGFCWLRVTSDGFRWFAVLVIISVSQHTEH